MIKIMNKDDLPSTWEKVAKVKDIIIYPVKSCKGMSIPTAETTTLGLKSGNNRDRTFMVVNSRNNFTTGRQHGKLVLVSAMVEGDVLKLAAPDMKSITIPIPTQSDAAAETYRVWGEAVEGLDCGESAATWLSSYLANSFRLVYFPRTIPTREADVKPFYPLLKTDDASAYADVAPYLLLSEASVEELNTNLKEAVTFKNFRPNILITESDAFQEDDWDYLKIGDAVFCCTHPCLRCVFTTVNPNTGERNKEKQPLQALQSFRQVLTNEEKKAYGTSPRFGVYLSLRSSGVITVGDTVYAGKTNGSS